MTYDFKFAQEWFDSIMEDEVVGHVTIRDSNAALAIRAALELAIKAQDEIKEVAVEGYMRGVNIALDKVYNFALEHEQDAVIMYIRVVRKQLENALQPAPEETSNFYAGVIDKEDNHVD